MVKEQLNILLVEDQPQDYKRIATQLKALGHIVFNSTVTSSSLDACKLLSEHYETLDIVFLDIMLGEENLGGLDVANYIFQLGERFGRTLPIIVISQIPRYKIKEWGQIIDKISQSNSTYADKERMRIKEDYQLAIRFVIASAVFRKPLISAENSFPVKLIQDDNTYGIYSNQEVHIRYEDLLWIETSQRRRNYCIFHVKQELYFLPKLEARGPIKNFTSSAFEQQGIIQTHQSYVVNTKNITGMNKQGRMFFFNDKRIERGQAPYGTTGARWSESFGKRPDFDQLLGLDDFFS